MYKEQGAAFVPKYLELLETGGSEARIRKVGLESSFDNPRKFVNWASA
jgi:hypothetical protein